jgi:predicted MPP superfamily phosphohydrolase
VPHAPYLALLGDIGAPFQPHYKQFLATQSEQFVKVFVLLGNHEYYGNHSADEVVAKVRSICDCFNNVILMDRDVVRLTDRSVLAGCTLWSDICPGVVPLLNDFKKIRVLADHRKRRLDVGTYDAWHRRDVQWLETALMEHSSDQVVILTHHAPSHAMQGDYSGSLLCSAFATPLEHMMEADNIVAWASGHVHSNVDICINGVRNVSNCRGYKGEETRYREDVVISIL